MNRSGWLDRALRPLARRRAAAVGRHAPGIEQLSARRLFAADLDPLGLAELRLLQPAGTEDATERQQVPQAAVLVVVDARVELDQRLVDAIAHVAGEAGGAPTILRIDASAPPTDVFERIGQALAQRDGWQAVHVLSHGEAGRVLLGAQQLDAAAVDAAATELQRWSAHLAAGADILLYGCEAGAGSAGVALVDSLARATGADVAASRDVTGAADRGGNWSLEVAHGVIDRPTLSATDWHGTLALTPTLTLTPVNQGTAGSQVTVAVDAADAQVQNVAVSSTGQIAVVWTNQLDHGAHDVMLRLYDGSTWSADILVAQDSSGTQQQPVVAFAQDRAVVAWASRSVGGVFEIRAAAFDSSGSKATIDVAVSDPIVGIDQVSPTISTESAGRIAIGWVEQSATSRIHFRTYLADGTPYAPNTVVDPAPSAAMQAPSIATTATGETRLAWVQNGDIWAQRFATASGAALGTAFRVNTATAGIQAHAAVAADENGNFVVTWEDQQDGTVKFQRYSASGSTLGGNTTVSAGARPTVAMNASGEFVIGAHSGRDGSQAVWISQHAPNGQIKAQVVTHDSAAGAHSGVGVGLTGSTAVASWTGPGPGDGEDILLRRYTLNSAATIIASPPGRLAVDEASGTASFTLRLSQAPSAAVTIPISSSNPSAGTVSTSSVVLDGTNWSTGVTVTVSGVSDGIANGDTAWAVVLGAATSTDAAFNGLNAPDVAVTTYGADVNVLTVTTTANTLDGDTSSIAALLANKGGDGKISLREAVRAANNTVNASGGADRILFDIQGATTNGVYQINLDWSLDVITDAVVIDASSQPGYTDRPLVALRADPFVWNGVRLGAGSSGSTVRGLMFLGFSENAIAVTGSHNHLIAGNWFGMTATGADHWELTGVALSITDGAGTTFGGATALDRNIVVNTSDRMVRITGEASDGNRILGNWLGVGINGNASGSNQAAIYIGAGADDTQVGGVGLGNWIAVPSGAGIELDSAGALTGTVIQGNRIGTNLAGTADWGTGWQGIYLHGAGVAQTLIGGELDGQGNVIAFSGKSMAAGNDQGIGIAGEVGLGNRISGNLIYASRGAELDLGRDGVDGADRYDAGDTDAGPNSRMNAPLLAALAFRGPTQIGIQGGYTGLANTTFRVEYFSTPDSTFAVAPVFLGAGTFVTNGAGNASWTHTLTASTVAGHLVYATATAIDGPQGNSTSEFSDRATIVNGTPPVNTVPGPASVAEDGSRTLPGIAVSDVDGDLATVRLQIANGRLGVTLSGNASIVAGANASGTLTLAGSTAAINATLASLSWTPTANFNGSDTLTVTSTDFAGLSDIDTVALTVTPVNDAPTLTPAGLLLSTVEDGGAPGGAVGWTVGSLLGGHADVDGAMPRGIAIVSVDSSQGTWWVTFDQGANWSVLATASAGDALLLQDDGSSRIAFQPAANFHGSLAGALGFRAWDLSSGSAGARADTRVHGGTTAFSSAIDFVDVDVAPVNDSPVVSLPPPQTGTEDSTFYLSPIAVSDVDGDTLTVRLTVAHGSLSLSLVGGTTLTAGAQSTATLTVSGTAADLNQSLATIVYQTTPDFAGADGLDVRVTDPQGADATAQVAIQVDPINDAPTLTPTRPLRTVTEDTAVAIRPADLLALAADVDTGALRGIAVTATDETHGLWWYSIDHGATWQQVGTVDPTQALLLREDGQSLLAFAPAANFQGSLPAALTFRAWDASSGVAGARGDASTQGGTTAFSTAQDVVDIDVLSVNDAPTLTLRPPTTLPEDGTAALAGITVGDIDHATDPLTIQLTVGHGRLLLTPSGGASVIAGASGSASLTLRGLASDLNDTLASLGYAPDPDFHGSDTLAILATDPGGLTAAGAVGLTVTPVNDAPTLAPSGQGWLEYADTPAPSGASGRRLADLLGGFADVDGGTPAGAALVGADSSLGRWWYSTDGGSTWAQLGAVGDDHALLLQANALTRLDFAPDPGTTGDVAGGLTLRGWDGSSGSAGAFADTRANGGGSAFSSATEAIALSVQPQAAIVVTATQPVIAESGSLRFTVALDPARPPTAAVSLTLQLVGADAARGALSAATLNWAAGETGALTVTLRGLDDSVVNGDAALQVRFGRAASDDLQYAGVHPADLALTLQDDDVVNRIVVDTTSDTVDADTRSLAALWADRARGDGRISLREALLAANAGANGPGGADVIGFDLGALDAHGEHVIALTHPLPTVTDRIVLDGLSDPAAQAAGHATVVLDGGHAVDTGLLLGDGADGSTVRGLVLRAFNGTGLVAAPGSDDHLLVSNVVGAYRADGSILAGAGNGQHGVRLEGSRNVLGGSTAAERNLIGGNGAFDVVVIGAGAAGNVVQGNWIGVDATGSTALANGSFGVIVDFGARDTRIGGSAAGQGNVIAGHTGSTGSIHGGGIYLSSDGVTTIQGNFVGVAANGFVPLGNGRAGAAHSGGIVVMGTGNGSATILDNHIAWNQGAGIAAVAGRFTALGNTFHENSVLAIDLNDDGVSANDPGDADAGANQTFNRPVLTEVLKADDGRGVWVAGRWEGAPGTAVRLEFFASSPADPSGAGEATQFAGAIDLVADAQGVATFGRWMPEAGSAVGDVFTATATESLGGNTWGVTSEFADNRTIASAAAPGFLVSSPDWTMLGEAGGRVEFTVTLAAPPTQDVTLTLGVSDASEGRVDRSVLTFTAADWQRPQTVVVHVQDDPLVDGDRGWQVILGPAASADPRWQGLTPDPIGFLTLDDDRVNTLTVTTTADVLNGDVSSMEALLANDGGDGISLREALEAANRTPNAWGGVDVIRFALPGDQADADGRWTIRLGAALPTMTGGLRLDATTQTGFAGTPLVRLDGQGLAIDGLTLGAGAVGGEVRGLQIDNLGGSGIALQAGADGNLIAGNWIGRLGAADGTVGSGMRIDGDRNQVGGATAADRNVVAGTLLHGVTVGGDFNTLQGNWIGLRPDAGVAGTGGSGILISANGDDNRIGGVVEAEGNRIAGSGGAGIGLEGSGPQRNVLLGNTVTGSAGLPIDLGLDGSNANDPDDLDAGANALQNSPELLRATWVDGVLTLAGRFQGAADATLRLEFFSAGPQPGAEALIGHLLLRTDAQGAADFEVQFAAPATAVGSWLRASATDLAAATTSELSAALAVVAAPDTAPGFAPASGQVTTANATAWQALLTQADGRLVAAGTVAAAGGGQDLVLARFLADGRADTGFGEGGVLQLAIGTTVQPTALVERPDGGLLLVGALDGAGMLLRLDAFGQPVPSFFDQGVLRIDNAGGDVICTSAIALPGGGVLVAGQGAGEAGMVQLDAQDRLSVPAASAQLAAGGWQTITALTRQPDGRVLVAGSAGGQIALARLREDGTLDTGFGAGGAARFDAPGGAGHAAAVIARDDGTAVLVGDGTAGAIALRVGADGVTQAVVLLDPGIAGIDAAVRQPDGHIVLLGHAADGSAVLRRLTPDGGVDGAWAGADTPQPAGATAAALAVRPDGRLVLAGALPDGLGGRLAVLRAVDAEGLSDRSFGPATPTIPADVAAAEDAAAVPLAPLASVFDRELATRGWGGATLTLQRESGPDAQDIFESTDARLAPLHEGATLQWDGHDVGQVVANAGGRLQLRFAVGSRADDIDAVLRTLGYRNASDAPPAQVDLVWLLDDGNTDGAQGSGGPLTGTATTRVAIAPSPDAPVMTGWSGAPAVSIDIPEFTPAGSVVALPAAIDPDGEPLTWSVSGADAARFAIDSTTGALSIGFRPVLLAPADADQDGVHEVIVSATDPTGRVATQTLRLHITDVNEPPFVTGPLAFQVDEHSPVGTVVGTLQAQDHEGGPLTWSLRPGGDAALVALDPATGALRLAHQPAFAHPLDADADNLLSFDVEVADPQGLTTRVAVTLAISNVNDAPVIGGADTAAEPLRVASPENLPVEVAIATFQADDVDGDAVRWSLDGPDAGAFTLDPSRGALHWRASPDFEQPQDADRNGRYELVLIADDGHGGRTHRALQVTVDDVNEAPRVVLPAELTLRLVGIDHGAVLSNALGLTGTDPDAGQRPLLRLVDDADGRFRLDPATGRLSAVDPARLAQEGSRGYALTVEADDGHGGTDRRALHLAVDWKPSLAIDPLPPAHAAADAGPAIAAPAHAPSPAPAADDRTPEAARPHAVVPPAGAAAPTTPVARELARQIEQAAVQFAAARPLLLSRRATVRDPVPAAALQPEAARWAESGAVGLDVGADALSDRANGMLSLRSAGAIGRPAAEWESLGVEVPEQAVEAGADGQAWLLSPGPATGFAAAAGALWWLSRAGGLAATMLLSMPAWRHIDLLPVLQQGGLDDDDDDDTDAEAGATVERGGDATDEPPRRRRAADLFDGRPDDPAALAQAAIHEARRRRSAELATERPLAAAPSR